MSLLVKQSLQLFWLRIGYMNVQPEEGRDLCAWAGMSRERSPGLPVVLSALKRLLFGADFLLSRCTKPGVFAELLVYTQCILQRAWLVSVLARRFDWSACERRGHVGFGSEQAFLPVWQSCSHNQFPLASSRPRACRCSPCACPLPYFVLGPLLSGPALSLLATSIASSRDRGSSACALSGCLGAGPSWGRYRRGTAAACPLRGRCGHGAPCQPGQPQQRGRAPPSQKRANVH